MLPLVVAFSLSLLIVIKSEYFSHARDDEHCPQGWWALPTLQLNIAA
jgi:hypothetical protein